MRKHERQLRGEGLDKYAIYKEFRDGMLCAIAVKQVPDVCTAHWNAGWKAGKDAMHEKLNDYLSFIGCEKMGVVTPAAASDEPDPRSLCRGCGKPLDPAMVGWCADGCPCNSHRGINHGLVPKDTCTCAECDPEQTGSVRVRGRGT